MLRLVLNDYRCRFSMEFKAIYKDMIYLLFIYIEILAYMRVNFVKYSACMVPLLFGYMISRMYPNQLSKMLFLCPLSAEDRKKYMNTAYFVRISIPLVLWALLVMPITAVGYFTIFDLVTSGVLLLGFCAGMNMNHTLLSLRIIIPEENEIHHVSFVHGILKLFLQIITWATAIYYAFDLSRTGIHINRTVVAILLIIEMVISAALILISYKPVMELGTQYECCRPILINNKWRV